MSSDEIKQMAHQFAEADTPSEITVPRSWPGLAAWASVRLGPWAIIAFAMGWWVLRLDERFAARELALLEAYQNATATQAEISDALRDLTRQTELNTAAVADLYHRLGLPDSPAPMRPSLQSRKP